MRFPGQWADGVWAGSGEGLYYNVHRWYVPNTGRFTRPDPVWTGEYRNTNHYLYAIGNPINFWDADGRDYNPPPAGGFLENRSPCPLQAFGDLGPGNLSKPIIVPPRSVHVFGLLLRPGRSPLFGDVDFVCVDGAWIKIVGAAWVRTDGQLRCAFPLYRPANSNENRELPPCKKQPCQCQQ